MANVFTVRYELISLGAFAKLRKATISFAVSPSVCPSVRLEQLAFHWTDFHQM